LRTALPSVGVNRPSADQAARALVLPGPVGTKGLPRSCDRLCQGLCRVFNSPRHAARGPDHSICSFLSHLDRFRLIGTEAASRTIERAGAAAAQR
jgi:hypothetical protein